MLSRVVLKTTRLLLRLRLLHAVDVCTMNYGMSEVETSLHLVGRRQQLQLTLTGRSRRSELGPLSGRYLPSAESALDALSRAGTLHIACEMRTHSLL
jgi:hypothetical protein